MRVFVAGATGVLGRRIVRELTARGHEAVGLVRSEAGESKVRSLGGVPRRADLFDVDSLTKAAQGCEAVIHAATAIPTKVRTNPRDWSLNNRIRREGTRCLTTATARVAAQAYLQQSIVWAVRDPNGGPFDESAPAAPDPILASSLDGERIASEAGAEHDFQAGLLRCGVFYSADGWHTRILGESVVRGRPALVNRGDAVWSLLHADDCARAFVAAAENPRSGVWHVVDDRPVTLLEYLDTLAQILRARPPRHLPRWLARIALGKYAADLLSSSFPTSNARFRKDFDWRPAFPSVAEGLEEVVAAWRSEGFPPGRGA
jgi:nucleoside-diphosphate-sugar epimerase